jgi:hypothetical protein
MLLFKETMPEKNKTIYYGDLLMHAVLLKI